MKQISVLPKLKVKSSRVKGVSFHSKRPLIIVGLHSGVIELWDYSIQSLITKFEGHKGAVRSVNLHEDQPLCVSGGDDTLVRVWNYKLRKCFELRGHVDYIRSTVFHSVQPWIASASDDMTIRVWNWQSRTCLGVLTGHVHYVMCAQFHPYLDYIISGSLDYSMKVWNISSLHTKNLTTPGNMANEILRENNFPELFGDHPLLSCATLDKHDRGINWIAIHPVNGLIASCGDDKLIKLVRMTKECDLIESGVLRGHVSNVSSVIFHPREDYLISNSEDGSIRIWNLNTKRCETRYNHDGRFWALSSHKFLNLFASAHDNGFFVFKIVKERPISAQTDDSLFWIVKNTLMEFEFSSSTENSIMSIKHGIPTLISYNPSERLILIFYKKTNVSDSPSYELINMGQTRSRHSTMSGPAISGFWLSRNRFIILEGTGTVLVKNTKNEMTQKFQIQGCSAVFTAPPGQFLCSNDDKVMLYDMQLKRVVSSVTVSKPRRVAWSRDYSRLAVMAGKVLLVCGGRLEPRFRIKESFGIKSGVWDNNGVFIYSTTHHIKYCLPNGDSGIVRTIDLPLYLMRVEDNLIYVLDREGKLNRLVGDNSEYLFKLAIINREFDKVINIIRKSKLIGKSIVLYLEKKGFPQLALHFVSDDATRFGLAIQCGNIEMALQAALRLNKNCYWQKLASAAMSQGNIQVAERSLQVIKDYNKLCLFYAVTGNLENLSKMLKIAEHRGDACMQIQIALMMGNVEERIKVLLQSNLFTLAYVNAQCHGLEQVAAEISQSLKEVPHVPSQPQLMLPMPPLIVLTSNWPHYASVRAMDDTLLQSVPMEDVPIQGWDEEEDEEKDESLPAEDLGWDVDDLDIAPELEEETADIGEEIDIDEGLPPSAIWVRNAKCPFDYVVAGDFHSAMRVLRARYSICDFAPFEAIFLRIYSQSRTCLPTMPSTPLIFGYPQNNVEIGHKDGRSLLSLSPDDLKQPLSTAYELTSKGNFAKAVDLFREILLKCSLISEEQAGRSRSASHQLQDIITTCREYILGLSMELALKKMPKDSLEDQKRRCELSLYFANCSLQLPHQVLTLRNALNLTYRLKNYKTAINIANRLINLGPPGEVANQARKIISACNKNPVDTDPVDYDYLNPFEVCAASYRPIYKGTPCVRDPLTRAAYLPEYAGQTCRITLVSEIGRDVA